MTPPEWLVQAVDPWAQLYGDVTPLATVVVFCHLAPLLFAGGLAVAMDRATLRAARDAGLRTRQLADLAAAHRVVVAGLVTSFVTGVLLFTADLEAYYMQPIYLTKMTLVVLLLANGYAMTRAEKALAAGGDADALWRRMRLASYASLFLWFAITFVGVAMVKS